ncbi:MAG: Maf family protein, partial [Acinetobacter sp.]|nr:Maf family protein [Acinetobacter sp.]
AIVIGSDQVAWRLHEPQHFLGKPLTVENAIKQLQQCSGQSIVFSTALSVIHLANGFEHTVLEHFQVKFRDLSLDEIQRYIQADDPLHCAGSFKCEQLGISLFESMHGNDFTSLMGLPLIQLCHILRKFDFQLP